MKKHIIKNPLFSFSRIFLSLLKRHKKLGPFLPKEEKLLFLKNFHFPSFFFFRKKIDCAFLLIGKENSYKEKERRLEKRVKK